MAIPNLTSWHTHFNRERERLSPSLSYRVIAKSVLKIHTHKKTVTGFLTLLSIPNACAGPFFFSRGNIIANLDLSPIRFLHDKILIYIRTPSL